MPAARRPARSRQARQAGRQEGSSPQQQQQAHKLAGPTSLSSCPASPAQLPPAHPPMHPPTPAHLGGQVLQDGGGVHRGGGTHAAVGGGAALEQTVDTAHGELQAGTRGTRDGLLLVAARALDADGTLGTLRGGGAKEAARRSAAAGQRGDAAAADVTPAQSGRGPARRRLSWAAVQAASSCRARAGQRRPRRLPIPAASAAHLGPRQLPRRAAGRCRKHSCRAGFERDGRRRRRRWAPRARTLPDRPLAPAAARSRGGGERRGGGEGGRARSGAPNNEGVADGAQAAPALTLARHGWLRCLPAGGEGAGGAAGDVRRQLDWPAAPGAARAPRRAPPSVRRVVRGPGRAAHGAPAAPARRQARPSKQRLARVHNGAPGPRRRSFQGQQEQTHRCEQGRATEWRAGAGRSALKAALETRPLPCRPRPRTSPSSSRPSEGALKPARARAAALGAGGCTRRTAPTARVLVAARCRTSPSSCQPRMPGEQVHLGTSTN